MLVGVLGGGQLGRMLALAGVPMGMRFRFLDPAPESPARHVGELMVADFEDTTALDAFARGLDLVTFEFENVPADSVAFLAARLPTFPPVGALRTGQDRIEEKRAFQRAGLPVPEYRPASNEREFLGAVRDLGAPLVVKTRRGGYDGKGQAVVREPRDAERAWDELAHACEGPDGSSGGAHGGGGLIVERMVPWRRELSIIGVRGRDGAVGFYPLTQNHHARGILRTSLAPAPGVDDATQRRAQDHLRTLMDHLGYVGVMALELFEDQDGALLGNEFAPRVHNSGHWTIEGALTSQFENHLRAVAGLPLGSTALTGSRAAMVNFIGALPAHRDLLALDARWPGVRVHPHDYAKAPRPGRKVGHATLVQRPGCSDADFDAALAALRSLAER
jgi:5-(carboxyamino)imidazole ribonucleotide synthase